MVHIQIAPSILAADFAYLGDAVRLVESAGADAIHIDVMDGHFVPNLTIGPLVVAALRRVTQLPLDVHLMIANPDACLEDFARAGATALTVHPEACIHLHRTLAAIRDMGMQAAVALNPATSEAALQYVLSLLDGVLVMTVNPGFGGQEFIRAVLPKIGAVRRMLAAAHVSAWLSVDGGINKTTAPWVVAEGADILVAGSAIFGAPEGAAKAVANLRSVI